MCAVTTASVSCGLAKAIGSGVEPGTAIPGDAVQTLHLRLIKNAGQGPESGDLTLAVDTDGQLRSYNVQLRDADEDQDRLYRDRKS